MVSVVPATAADAVRTVAAAAPWPAAALPADGAACRGGGAAGGGGQADPGDDEFGVSHGGLLAGAGRAAVVPLSATYGEKGSFRASYTVKVS